MKQNLNILLVIATLLVGGCTTSTPYEGDTIDATETQLIDYPELGVMNEADLGERLVAKGYKTVGPAIRVVEQGCVSDCTSIMMCSVNFILPDEQESRLTHRMLNERSEPANCYKVNYKTIQNANCFRASTVFAGYICQDEAGWFKPAFTEQRAGRESTRMKTGKIEKITLESLTQPSYVQEVIYNGRVNDSLKFVYREYSGDMIRPAFTQEVQYDLNQSNIVGFKDLRLRVIEASNITIRYELLNNF